MTAEAAGTANRAETTHITTTAKAPALAWRDVRVVYAPRARGTEPVVAVDGVSLAVPRGGTVGIAGESGCGKSTLALSALRLLPRTARVDGAIEIAGEDARRPAATR
jgi:peptide/nickel transport system ATP-binding protein